MSTDRFGLGAIVETAVIPNGTIIKKGAAENGVVIAGANELAVGISAVSQPGTSTPVGEEVTQVYAGRTHVLLGATLARGAKFVSDATGQAVAGAGTTFNNIVGMLLESGISGDLVECNVLIASEDTP